MNLRIVAAVLGLGLSVGLTYNPSAAVSDNVSDVGSSEPSDEALARFELNTAAFNADSAIDTPLMVTIMERGRNLSRTNGDGPGSAPEPATLAALGIGALALFAKKRRRP